MKSRHTILKGDSKLCPKKFANCKCKLDTCTVELSESERRSGWKSLASVLDDAAAAFGCVNRVGELVKQFLRGAVAKLLAGRPFNSSAAAKIYAAEKASMNTPFGTNIRNSPL